MKKHRIFIKLGTSTLTAKSKCLNKAVMLEIARTVHLLFEKGYEVGLVSSGAIAAGREALNYPNLPPEISSKQLLASVGQVHLIKLWTDLFDIFNLKVGQLLLTRADLQTRERYLNAKDTLEALFKAKIVPIINENDAVSISEIKVGDNDNLAALSAVLADADCVILLTDQKGLYTADPRENKDAKLIFKVDEIDDKIVSLAGGAGSLQGTGGMATKIKAAKTATSAGVSLIIASGQDPSIVLKLVEGKGEGTFFTPSTHPVLARKSWIGSALRKEGELVVDEGAYKAVIERGSSLLPGGILSIIGHFDRGGCVEIKLKDGRCFARGLVRYNDNDLNLIKGHRSCDFEEILGYTHGDVAIHRDDLVVLANKEESL